MTQSFDYHQGPVLVAVVAVPRNLAITATKPRNLAGKSPILVTHQDKIINFINYNSYNSSKIYVFPFLPPNLLENVILF